MFKLAHINNPQNGLYFVIVLWHRVVKRPTATLESIKTQKRIINLTLWFLFFITWVNNN